MIRAEIETREVRANAKRFDVDEIVVAEIQNPQALAEAQVADLDDALGRHVEVVDRVQVVEARRERHVLASLIGLVGLTLLEPLELLQLGIGEPDGVMLLLVDVPNELHGRVNNEADLDGIYKLLGRFGKAL